ncbi:MAG: hypothetical protein ACXWN0_13200, partial [Isosphaeraceae bacterium]
MSHVSYESSNKHELSVRSNTSLSRDEARKRRRVLVGVELLENRITLSRLTLLPASLPSVAVGQNYQVADTVSPTGFTDPGFENPSQGTGGSAYQYDPTGTAWSFSGSAGLAGNGSGFTSGNPNAPQGSQVAFLQATGTISQVVNFAAADSYLISVSAAQRGNFGTSNEKVQVLVDGPVVGTITPASTRYTTYTTASFNVTAGSHTITFVGVDPTGKDYTAFLDQVSIDIVSPTGDWFSRNMTDPGLQDLARWDFSRDSSLDYSDMLNLFAAAESAGSVTSAELQ